MRFRLHRSKLGRFFAAAAFAGAAGSFASGQQLTPPAVEGSAEVQTEVEVEVQGDDVNAYVVAEDKSPWIGVAGVDLPPALAAQLKLDKGVLVEDVVSDSPAAKAGVQKYDVLLSMGDKATNSRDDLVAAVQAAGEKEVELSLLRGGAKQSLKITPSTAARPKVTQVEADVEFEFKPFIEGLSKLEGEQPRRMLLLGPGVMPPGFKFDSGALPGNLTVEIRKEGDQPAKITVKRGDEHWEITSEELAKLPEELRPHVEKFLGGRGPVMFRERLLRGREPDKDEAAEGAEERIVEEGKPGERRELRIRRIAPPGLAPEAMRKHMEEMRKHLDEMRLQLGTPEDGLQELRDEVERLRKEVEELRGEKAGGKEEGAKESGSST